MEKVYVVEAADKVLSFKAFVEDVKALTRTKRLMDERVIGSVQELTVLAAEIQDDLGTDTLYEIGFNLVEDTLKDNYPAGRNVTDVTAEQLAEMRADASIEVCSVQKYSLSKQLEAILNAGL